jgi:hypothetical protein
MKISLIGHRYVVKDGSYSKDLSGNCEFPHLSGQESIIIRQPYTECVNDKEELFVDIVIPNNPFYKYQYRVLFCEWGLLDKGKRKQNKSAVLGFVGTIYHPTYNASNCRMLDNDIIEGYLSHVDCEIISLPYNKTFQSIFEENKIETVKVINVRSLETGIEYCIDYRKDWIVRDTHNGIEDSEWNFCPHCGKILKYENI